MLAEIIGTRRVDMDSENIHGWSIYTKHEEDGVNGLMAERFFVSDQMINRDVGGLVPEPGQAIDFEWGRTKNKIGSIRSLG